MNRTVIRLFGFCTVIFGLGGQRYVQAAEPTLPTNCGSGSYGDLYGVKYQHFSCEETLTGWLGFNISANPCTDATVQTFTGCAGGYCNGTGIYCETPDYFVGLGCIEDEGGRCYFKSGVFDKTSSEDGYYFIGCATGYYQNPEVSGSGIILPFAKTVEALRVNCSPCSGFHFISGRFETYAVYDGTTSTSGFYWVAPSGYGIESCRGMSSEIITDNAGTFQLANVGCPYVK